MRKYIWLAFGTAAVVWSLVAWTGYAVVANLGGVAASIGTVPGFTPEPFSIAWAAAQVRAIGLNWIFVVWLIGLTVIAGFAAIVKRMMGRQFAPPRIKPHSAGSSFPN